MKFSTDGFFVPFLVFSVVMGIQGIPKGGPGDKGSAGAKGGAGSDFLKVRSFITNKTNRSPSNKCKHFIVYCTGGGGGAAGGGGTGGGGGGGTAINTYDASVTTSYNIVIGSGGEGGGSENSAENEWQYNNGSTGGSSTFTPNSGTKLTGGGGGRSTNTGGGAGGTASGGEVNLSGSPGVSGTAPKTGAIGGDIGRASGGASYFPDAGRGGHGASANIEVDTDDDTHIGSAGEDGSNGIVYIIEYG